MASDDYLWTAYIARYIKIYVINQIIHKVISVYYIVCLLVILYFLRCIYSVLKTLVIRKNVLNCVIAVHLNKCKWINIKNMIDHSMITTIHSIMSNNTPQSIIKLLNNTHNSRVCKEIKLRYIPRTLKYRKFFLVSGLKIYNDIPSNFKQKSQSMFKKLTKKWIISYNGVHDSGD